MKNLGDGNFWVYATIDGNQVLDKDFKTVAAAAKYLKKYLLLSAMRGPKMPKSRGTTGIDQRYPRMTLVSYKWSTGLDTWMLDSGKGLF